MKITKLISKTKNNIMPSLITTSSSNNNNNDLPCTNNKTISVTTPDPATAPPTYLACVVTFRNSEASSGKTAPGFQQQREKFGRRVVDARR